MTYAHYNWAIDVARFRVYNVCMIKLLAKCVVGGFVFGLFLGFGLGI